MLGRDTRKNIKGIREEIKTVNIALGITKNLSSVTKMNEQCRNLAKNLSGPAAKDETTKRHRLLNAYVHDYKDMLSLN